MKAERGKIDMPEPVLRALLAYQQHRLHPMPVKWQKRVSEDGAVVYDLLDGSGIVLADYSIKPNLPRGRLVRRGASKAVLLETGRRVKQAWDARGWTPEEEAHG